MIMKKVLLVLACAGVLFSASAQGDKMATKSEKKEMKKKEHVCTAACTKEKHVYAHGEKGHTCTDACHKKM
jgi:photosystem II stability/assembly factor-like uncharacterized protein